MFNITVYRMSQFRAAQKVQRELVELCEVVLCFVHIDNLGALPPSPWVLRAKARQIGLI